MYLNEHFKKYKGIDPFNDIIGQNFVKGEILSALIMNRHILLVGAPGIGKTTLAKNIAFLLPEIEVNDCGFNCMNEKIICPRCKNNVKHKKIRLNGAERFIRIQGSPDLTAEDLIGDIDPIKALEFGPLNIESFTPGKIFKANQGVLFFDELNRAPEKLQNALLQVLEERKATIGSYTVDIETDFIFIATMNPDDFSGTEKLSEVLLDRLDLVYVKYPENIENELKIIEIKGKRLKEVEFNKELLKIVLGFIHELRMNKDIERAPSVRASLGLYERAQANAFLRSSKKVEIDDIINALFSVISHRIRLKPSIRYLMNEKEFIKKTFNEFLKQRKEKGEIP
ncbi:AAA family ATPase [Candidatus Woesearchaeota archaeon]|nr:AAA family ATPase [Candidatus Woesearchaeota archaeon]